MAEAAFSSVCPDCGTPKAPGACERCRPGSLEAGTLLQGRYLVAALRRRDPLGFRHLGVDQKTEKLVTVREFVPVGLGGRQDDGAIVVAPEDRARWSAGMRGFMLRYDRFAALAGPSIVGARAKFMANGTAYAILEQEPGESLGALLEQGERFRDSAREAIVQDVLRALSAFHRRGVAFMGLHPWTVALNEAGRARLIDVGWYEPELAEGLTEAERRLLPPEVQAQPKAWQPSGDLYALGAFAIALEQGLPVSEAEIEAGRRPGAPDWLQRLLQLEPADRPPDADTMLETWDEPAPEPPPPGLLEVMRTRLDQAGSEPPPPLARRALLFGALSLTAGAAGALTYGFMPRAPGATLVGAWRGAPGGVTSFEPYAGADNWDRAKAVAARSRGGRLFIGPDRLSLEAPDLRIERSVRLRSRGDGRSFSLDAGPEESFELELDGELLRLRLPSGEDRVFRRVPTP